MEEIYEKHKHHSKPIGQVSHQLQSLHSLKEYEDEWCHQLKLLED